MGDPADLRLGSSPKPRPAGARSYRELDPVVLADIQRGVRVSRTHVEQMAVDMTVLLREALPDLACATPDFSGLPFLNRMRHGAMLLFNAYGPDAATVALRSRSDIVRGWGAFAVALRPGARLESQLLEIEPFARDDHFAVREWAWLAVRPNVIANTRLAISLLEPWALDGDEYRRRFAIEVTRPRSVWGKHCPALKNEPWLGLGVLEPAVGDRRRYVEDALANWMNDARRLHPEWVTEICRQWHSAHGATVDRLVRRAHRLPAGQWQRHVIGESSQASQR